MGTENRNAEEAGFEIADVPVMFSVELLDELTEWSRPVQIRSYYDGANWTLEVREAHSLTVNYLGRGKPKLFLDGEE